MFCCSKVLTRSHKPGKFANIKSGINCPNLIKEEAARLLALLVSECNCCKNFGPVVDDVCCCVKAEMDEAALLVGEDKEEGKEEEGKEDAEEEEAVGLLFALFALCKNKFNIKRKN